MRCTGYEMARYKGTQASHLYEKSMHTLCTIQWATTPGRSLNYPRPKSIPHLRTFSDNGVYVALQLFLVILVSDQWRRVLSIPSVPNSSIIKWAAVYCRSDQFSISLHGSSQHILDIYHFHWLGSVMILITAILVERQGEKAVCQPSTCQEYNVL